MRGAPGPSRSLRPRVVAAIDAGSNGLRILIASTQEGGTKTILRGRAAVRLGHNVFTKGRLDRRTIRRAVQAFSEFRRLMDRQGVEKYRAVATSAAREATNRRKLVVAIREQSGIDLEIIDGDEESRLERLAVLRALRNTLPPAAIVDLGGGSLEVSFLRGGKPAGELQMRVGTVRLMEKLRVHGRISHSKADKLRRTVNTKLDRALEATRRRDIRLPPRSFVVACGGNAERFAQLAGGARVGGHPTIDMARLRRALPHILELSVDERMEAFGVRRDRAEVMGIAGIVFDLLCERLGVDRLLVPGVGVREGVIADWEPQRRSRARSRGRSSRSRFAVVKGYENLSMRLILIRHGIAIDREDPACPPDPERFLTRKGVERTRKAMLGLKVLGLAPQAVLSSPFLRARQTAEIAAKVLGFPLEKIQNTRALEPERDPAELFRELAGLKAQEILCFGHAPNLDEVLASAVGARTPITALKKAGAACVEIDALQPATGVLEWILPAAVLRSLEG